MGPLPACPSACILIQLPSQPITELHGQMLTYSALSSFRLVVSLRIAYAADILGRSRCKTNPVTFQWRYWEQPLLG